ncbi:MAG: hypothetical protein JRH20_27430 [Deltaproteobacteria bacterium]|nr:hypothetical protein [Deltaproteobacteria bacterium]
MKVRMMRNGFEINGQMVPVEIDGESQWRCVIESGTEEAAQKIADKLDREAEERTLEKDEERLRRIIKEVKGF